MGRVLQKDELGCVYRGEREGEGEGVRRRAGERLRERREREAGDWEVSEREPDFFLSRLTVINLSPAQSLPSSDLALLLGPRGSR